MLVGDFGEVFQYLAEGARSTIKLGEGLLKDGQVDELYGLTWFDDVSLGEGLCAGDEAKAFAGSPMREDEAGSL